MGRGRTPGLRALRAMVSAVLAGRLAKALEGFTTHGVVTSARKVTVLAGSLKTTDREGYAEPATFVDSCQVYVENGIPCSCDSVRFDGRDGEFWPGWERFWHRPTLERLLTVQPMMRREVEKLLYLGPYHWHCMGMGLFKNSLDTGYFIASAFANSLPHLCASDPRCILTDVIVEVLNWVVSLMQFSLIPIQRHIDPYDAMLKEMASGAHLHKWGEAPWRLLLERPGWADALLLMADMLEDTVAADNAELPGGLGDGERFERSAQRMGIRDAPPAGEQLPCAQFGANWPAWWASEAPENVLDAARLVAFGDECRLFLIKRLVLFTAAIRPVLPRPAEAPWPPPQAIAEVPPGPWLCRLCGGPGVVIHRRIGHVELHFLAADVVKVGGEFQLDLLWLATSDDGCTMVGTSFHNAEDETHMYYSFAHTLPGAHAVQWRCDVRVLDSAEEAGVPSTGSSVTVSFSGFLSITTCRLPAGAAKAFVEVNPPQLELALEPESAAAGAWRPEPLRLCGRVRPTRRRVLSACTATLHSADYVHAVVPHAVEDWINYHLLIGIEHITVFDTDGSYEPYVRRFVERGQAAYYGRFPAKVTPTLGMLAAGLADRQHERPMVLEPHALDVCVWQNRQVSDYVVVIHSFEEYLHSSFAVDHMGRFQAAQLVSMYMREAPNTSHLEIFQEPMGGARQRGARSVLSTWTHRRGLDIPGPGAEGGQTTEDQMNFAHVHFQPFAWIVDPLNVLQTAVHFAQARAHGQTVVVLPRELMHVKHYVDLGSNASRCLEELGGCDVPDESILWAEDQILGMRHGVLEG